MIYLSMMNYLLHMVQVDIDDITTGRSFGVSEEDGIYTRIAKICDYYVPKINL